LIVHVLATAASAPPKLPGFLNALSSPLQHFGLWAIIFLVFVEDFGIPVPGETILIAGAVYAGSGGLNIVAVGVCGFVAAILGDNVGYAIGRYGGRALVVRWGKYVWLTEERLATAEAFFERHGGKIIVIARFIEGLRQANGLIAGLTRMRWLKFAIYNMIGAALWVGCWVSIGFFAGQHITTIYNYVTRYTVYAVIVIVVALVLLIIVRLRRKRHEENGSVTETTSEAEPEPETKSETTPESETTPGPESEPGERGPESGPRPVGRDESAADTDQVPGNS
jgi:membrane protein DedA with SNARE-associated domain